ncbi:MAG: Lrp/AsnC ligand binding domain-containing protein [Thermomicrobium sp.]|nr:Lrp/AsnC ligand binding domain-containing protein [Thermomicrobium sp.]MDW8060938.1 Lrp/AsnC ligand binding domain-containing protein [Thermomicrobium sp.]
MAARAYVLVHCDVGKAREVKEALVDVPGVQRADIVTGDYDLIVLVEQPTVEELGRLVLERIHGTPGVTATSTHVVVG